MYPCTPHRTPLLNKQHSLFRTVLLACVPRVPGSLTSDRLMPIRSPFAIHRCVQDRISAHPTCPASFARPLPRCSSSPWSFSRAKARTLPTPLPPRRGLTMPLERTRMRWDVSTGTEIPSVCTPTRVAQLLVRSVRQPSLKSTLQISQHLHQPGLALRARARCATAKTRQFAGTCVGPARACVSLHISQKRSSRSCSYILLKVGVSSRCPCTWL
jgi:hypothetical protein